jgi:hypothetical protein
MFDCATGSWISSTSPQGFLDAVHMYPSSHIHLKLWAAISGGIICIIQNRMRLCKADWNVSRETSFHACKSTNPPHMGLFVLDPSQCTFRILRLTSKFETESYWGNQEGCFLIKKSKDSRSRRTFIIVNGFVLEEEIANKSVGRGRIMYFGGQRRTRTSFSYVPCP